MLTLFMTLPVRVKSVLMITAASRGIAEPLLVGVTQHVYRLLCYLSEKNLQQNVRQKLFWLKKTVLVLYQRES